MVFVISCFVSGGVGKGIILAWLIGGGGGGGVEKGILFLLLLLCFLGGGGGGGVGKGISLCFLGGGGGVVWVRVVFFVKGFERFIEGR